MIYSILPIIILVIELLLVGYYIFYAVKTQKFISKGTLIYFVPISIILFVLYTLGASYNAEITNVPLNIVDYMGICKSVISATVFELKIDYVSELMKVNQFFNLSYYIAVGLSVACVYTSVISLVINNVVNTFRLVKVLSKDCDILIGENNCNSIYFNDNKNIIVISDNTKSINPNEYYSKKIPLIQNRFTAKTLLKWFKHSIKKGRELNFISFQDGSNNLRYIKEFEDFLSLEVKKKKISEYKTCYLKVEIEYNNQISIKNKILENKAIAAYIDCFTRYELFSLNFIERNPITEHLPSHFIDEETASIKNDKTINVIYLGFGKLSKTLHRVQLMNDQLPTISKNGTMEGFKINYFAFDKEKKVNEDKNSSFFSKRYDENISSYDNKEYFPVWNKLDNLIFEEMNIESYHMVNRIMEILKETKKENTYNRFIISYGDDIDNIDMTLKLLSILKEYEFENYEIYVRVNGEFPTAIKLLDNKKVNVIGNLKTVINHDVIVNERLLELAKLVNRKYYSKRLSESSWYNLTSIKQASNVYSSLNIRLKLNLLGYDYVRENTKVDNSLIIKEIEDKVAFENKKYDDYLFYLNKNNKPVHTLAFQEHQRWNAFYISNGYVPLRKDRIKLIDAYGEWGPSFYKDDNSLNLHACLTTYEGLDQYHKLLADLLTKENKKDFEDNLSTVETYKYDHMIVESFKPMFENSCYRIIKK